MGLKTVLYLLGLLFIGLKLTGYINWSWLVVVSPIIANFILVVLCNMVVIIIERYGKQ